MEYLKRETIELIKKRLEFLVEHNENIPFFINWCEECLSNTILRYNLELINAKSMLKFLSSNKNRNFMSENDYFKTKQILDRI